MLVPIQSNHMQIYKHEYTRIIQITQSCYVIIHFITSVRPEKFQFLEKGQNRNFDYKIVNFG